MLRMGWTRKQKRKPNFQNLNRTHAKAQQTDYMRGWTDAWAPFEAAELEDFLQNRVEVRVQIQCLRLYIMIEV